MDISEPLSYQLGLDGFIWWMGVVEAREIDVLHIGRMKVRIVNWHTDALATADLPWAMPLLPLTNPTAVPALKPGDWVIGFFMDGKLGQQPIVLGVLPAIAQTLT